MCALFQSKCSSVCPCSCTINNRFILSKVTAGWLCLLQNKVAHLSDLNDGKEAAGSPLFTYVDETIFKKETFLGKKRKHRMQMFPNSNRFIHSNIHSNKSDIVILLLIFSLHFTSGQLWEWYRCTRGRDPRGGGGESQVFGLHNKDSCNEGKTWAHLND